MKKNNWNYVVMAILFCFVSVGVFFLCLGQGWNLSTCIGATLLPSGGLFAALFAVWSIDWEA